MYVAIQGGTASFHDIAAKKYFPNLTDTIKCNTFQEVFDSLERNESQYALVAIENIIAGSILSNYTLIRKYLFPVIGEIRLRISMCLMALPDQDLADLTQIKSHYMALLQCHEFLSHHPYLKLEEYHDTADAAKYIKEHQVMGVGAIAGKYAEEVYGLNVLAEDIQTNKINYTRFLVLTNQQVKIEVPNKASLAFILKNEPGSLSKVLRIFDDEGINLSKIQSIPLLDTLDQYTFYVDCDWTDSQAYSRSIDKIRSQVSEFYELGAYQKGEYVN